MSDIVSSTYKSAINKIQKRIDQIDFILNSNPLSEIIQLRIDSQPLVKRICTSTKNGKASKEDMMELDRLAKKEKELFELAKKAQDSIKLINEKVKLESDLYELNSKAFWMNRNQQTGEL